MRALLALALLSSPALAETEVRSLTYLCDRGVAVPVVYVNATDTSLAVLHVDGRQILLYTEPAASGARYGWPSGGSHYIWWSKGDAATLLWRDGETTVEEPIYADCVVRE